MAGNNHIGGERPGHERRTYDVWAVTSSPSCWFALRLRADRVSRLFRYFQGRKRPLQPPAPRAAT